jgi:hypothetical protein
VDQQFYIKEGKTMQWPKRKKKTSRKQKIVMNVTKIWA